MNKQHFTMLELVASFIFLVVIMSGMVSYFKVLQHASMRNVQQSRALIVLDNTLERLMVGTDKQVPADWATHVLQDEFARMEMPRKSTLTPQVQDSTTGWTLAILKENGKPLASMTLPEGKTQ